MGADANLACGLWVAIVYDDPVDRAPIRKIKRVCRSLAELLFIMVVLAPHYNASWLPAFMVPGALLLTVWLLIKGVDLRKWEEKTADDSTV